MGKIYAAGALIVVLLSIYNAHADWSLKERRMESVDRQALINQGARYIQVNNDLINSLASVAAQTGDREITELLASEGVTFTVNNQSVDK